VSFNIGEFREFNITDARVPPVTVQVNLEAHRHLDAVLLQPRDPQVEVGADVANSLSFFSSVFGPPLFSRYYATEIPYGHGQAFPGLIHLSWFTFQSIDQSGFNEVFRAHEMAHQWWGIGVQPADYRDVWLSEGFADFAGLWYMQRILKDNPKYFHMLKTWGDAIRSRHDDAAPLALGTRAGEMNPGDYETIIYGKGAWVLQMLRNMMIDLKTMNEDAFTETMRDFYTQYRGRSASTRDFQRVVETHMGLPMGWFFDEWVYSSAIPTFVLSWRVDSTPEHPHVLHVRVRQEGVPKSFVMPVPLLIKFSDSAEVYVRVTSRGPLTEGQLALPRDPVRLELNPLQSVLANVKQEDWRTTP
jgi:aminopeptidase N